MVYSTTAFLYKSASCQTVYEAGCAVVRGNQMGGSVARQVGSGKLHVSGWKMAGGVSVSEWEVGQAEEQAAWLAVSLWAGGPGGAAQLPPLGRWEANGTVLTIVSKLCQSCHRPGV